MEDVKIRDLGTEGRDPEIESVATRLAPAVTHARTPGSLCRRVEHTVAVILDYGIRRASRGTRRSLNFLLSRVSPRQSLALSQLSLCAAPREFNRDLHTD